MGWAITSCLRYQGPKVGPKQPTATGLCRVPQTPDGYGLGCNEPGCNLLFRVP